MSEICRSLASYYWKSGVQEKPGSNLSPRFLFGMRNLRHVTLSNIMMCWHTTQQDTLKLGYMKYKADYTKMVADLLLFLYNGLT